MKENWVILVSRPIAWLVTLMVSVASSIRALRVRFPGSNSCFVHPLARYLVVVADFFEEL